MREQGKNAYQVDLHNDILKNLHDKNKKNRANRNNKDDTSAAISQLPDG